jgi:hypothetical protein
VLVMPNMMLSLVHFVARTSCRACTCFLLAISISVCLTDLLADLAKVV